MANANDATDLSHPEVVINEVLCFIQQKSEILAADDLMKICSDYYSVEDIEKARTTLARFVDKKRVPRQKGTDQEICCRTVTLMIKLCLDPSIHLPSFCALNISKLPPVDADHVDMSAVMSELSALRREVRAMSDLREEVRILKELLHKEPYVCNTCSHVTARDPIADDVDNQPMRMSFADKAQLLIGDTGAFKNVVPKRRKQPKKLVVGESLENKHVQSVTTVRTVDVFVSRLHPATTDEELTECVSAMKDNIDVKQVVCTRLKSRHENLYASYHVAICVDSAVLKHAVELFMSPAVWPCGIFVKRFFRKRDGSAQQ